MKKIYKFVDINETALERENIIDVFIDGTNLDRVVPGYSTLNVYGREVIGRNISTTNYQISKINNKTSIRGRRKAVQTNKFGFSSLPSRTLTIEYLMECQTEQEILRRFNDLIYYANREQVQISFSDDGDFYYVGTLSNFNELEANKFSFISNFTYECIDPYKYRKTLKKFIIEPRTQKEFNYIGKYESDVEEIRSFVSKDMDNLTIKNITSGAVIKINNPNHEVIDVILDIKNGEVRDTSGKNLIDKLDIFSDFEDFAVNYRDELYSNSYKSTEVYFREKVL